MNGQDDGILKLRVLHTDHYIFKNSLNTSDFLNPFEFNVLSKPTEKFVHNYLLLIWGENKLRAPNVL